MKGKQETQAGNQKDAASQEFQPETEDQASMKMEKRYKEDRVLN